MMNKIEHKINRILPQMNGSTFGGMDRGWKNSQGRLLDKERKQRELDRWLGKETGCIGEVPEE